MYRTWGSAGAFWLQTFSIHHQGIKNLELSWIEILLKNLLLAQVWDTELVRLAHRYTPIVFRDGGYPREMPCSHPVRMKFRRRSAWTFRRNVIAPWSNTSHSHSRLEKCWRSHPADRNFRAIPPLCTLRGASRCLEPHRSILIKPNWFDDSVNELQPFVLFLSRLWCTFCGVSRILYICISQLVSWYTGAISRRLRTDFPAKYL